MGLCQKLPSFSCELRILQAQNVDFKSSMGNFFVRLHLSTGNNKGIQLNTRKISPTSSPFWNESFSLDCLGAHDVLETLKQETLVLELRQSNTAPVVGKILGSRLMGRAEIPWKAVLERPNMVLEEWIKMDMASGRVLDGVKQSKLQVEIKIQVPTLAEMENRRRRENRMRLRNWDDCGCKQGHQCYSAEDYDIFALGASLEAF
ncbi:hypothetical protein L6164_012382 [Bauhinia variegata]|uniref:Uncharacterized protein n=1 Tax=Bauhinia variegata TaxID=167791 RepID=A0ACB9PB38_BAUVA|nr:hypothetical protein L6164_012382 [Bauhinia variegata]